MHPDKKVGQTPFNQEKFKQITSAYDILSCKDKRASYDKYRPAHEIHQQWNSKSATYGGFYKTTHQGHYQQSRCSNYISILR